MEELPKHAPPLATAALPIPKPPIKILPVILPPAKGRYAARVEPLSEMIFPVVPENTTTFPETEAPALETRLLALTVFKLPKFVILFVAKFKDPLSVSPDFNTRKLSAVVIAEFVARLDRATVLSAITLPVLLEKVGIFPKIEVPALETMSSTLRLFV